MSATVDGSGGGPGVAARSSGWDERLEEPGGELDQQVWMGQWRGLGEESDEKTTILRLGGLRKAGE